MYSNWIYKPNSVRDLRREAIIPLGQASLTGSSDLPGGLTYRAGACTRRRFLPIWSCSVWGLPCPGHYCPGGALLPHLFTLTEPRPGGMFSVALSVDCP